MKSEREYVSIPFAGEGAPAEGIFTWHAPDHSAIPKRGMEIGGLLFGNVRLDAGVPVFEITAAEEVPCEHRFGPSYTLDKQDRNRLSMLLARRRRDGSPPVIGFYRSVTGREPHLDESDREVLTELFPNRDYLYLLLHPQNADVCTGSFEIARGEAARQEEIPPEHAPRPLPASASEEVEQPVRRSNNFLVLALCILAALAVLAGYRWWRSGSAAEPGLASLGFDAQRSGNELMLRWNGSAPALTRATRGVISVNDGPQPSQIALTPDQLHRGFFPYRPVTASPLFQLKAYADTELVAADSVHIVEAPPAPAAPAAAPAAPASAAAAAPAAGTAPPAESVAAAIPRRKVEPRVSPGIRHRLTEPMAIPVVVQINAAGYVNHASSGVTEHGLRRYLANAAVKAAYRWRFTPAHSADGTPVASTTTITFEFTP
jgi:hypothetical protein